MALDKKWTDTMDAGLSDKAWDEYDDLIIGETNHYNLTFNSAPGYKKVNYLLFKAMMWTESGGRNHPDKQWFTHPMQIGRFAKDEGYPALKDAADHCHQQRKTVGYSSKLATKDTERDVLILVMSDDLKEKLRGGKINEPRLNIRAGMAYMMGLLARSDAKSVTDGSSRPEEAVLKEGESFDSVAKRLGSTPEAIHQENGGLKTKDKWETWVQRGKDRRFVSDRDLRPGDRFKVPKASLQRLIVRWIDFTPEAAQSLYNRKDTSYAEKLRYVLGLFGKLKR